MWDVGSMGWLACHLWRTQNSTTMHTVRTGQDSCTGLEVGVSVAVMLVDVVLEHAPSILPPVACQHLPLHGTGGGYLSSEAAH